MMVAYQIFKDNSYVCIPCVRQDSSFKGGPDNCIPIFASEISGTKLKCSVCNTKLTEVEAILKAKPLPDEEEQQPTPAKKRGRPAKK